LIVRHLKTKTTPIHSLINFTVCKLWNQIFGGQGGKMSHLENKNGGHSTAAFAGRMGCGCD
jgi:hypothetical protein